jgi:hypothetical protein
LSMPAPLSLRAPPVAEVYSEDGMVAGVVRG